MCLHHKTCEEWARFEILFFYILHNSIDLNLLDKLKKYQFLYMAIEGNRSIRFGAIIPYMVMEGNEGILFSVIINTVDVTVFLELVLYHSSIDFNPTVLIV